MKKELRYIRYKICRNIYYADQCPKDNRRNYNELARNALCALGLCGVGLVLMILLVLMAI